MRAVLTVKRSAAILLLSACAVAQSSDERRLSAGYAEAAVRVLAAISNERTTDSVSSDALVRGELANARVVAVSKADKNSLVSLRVFELVHSILLDQQHLRSGLYIAGEQKRADNSELERDGKCIVAWTDALRARDSERPPVCYAGNK